MSTKTRSAEISRRAIEIISREPICAERLAAGGENLLTFIFATAAKFAEDNEAILSVAEMDREDAQWVSLVITIAGIFHGWCSDMNEETLEVSAKPTDTKICKEADGFYCRAA